MAIPEPREMEEARIAQRTAGEVRDWSILRIAPRPRRRALGAGEEYGGAEEAILEEQGIP